MKSSSMSLKSTSNMLGSLAKFRSRVAQMGGEKSTDAVYSRAKLDFHALEQSVLTIRSEAQNYLSALHSLGENGQLMMDKIATMFHAGSSISQFSSQNPSSPLSDPASPSPISPMPSSDWPDPNEAHPYKDIARLLARTQAKISNEAIASSVRHLETRLLAKIQELTVKFDGLRDRIGDREKIKTELETMGKVVEQNKQRAQASKSGMANKDGEKHAEMELNFTDKKDEFERIHASLLRELQQYNENRLDILSALLLDLFAAQRHFAYAYGRSLWSTHQQMIDNDALGELTLPKPTWQALMSYVSETDEEECRSLQTGEPRPSLIMKLAAQDLAMSPARREPPSKPKVPAPSQHKDEYAQDDEVTFNPHLLQDRANEAYVPLSRPQKVVTQQSFADDPNPFHVNDTDEPGQMPVKRPVGIAPKLTEPAQLPMSVARFAQVHQQVAVQRSQQQEQRAGELDWAGSFGQPINQSINQSVKQSPASSSSFDMDFFSSSFDAKPSVTFNQPSRQIQPPPPSTNQPTRTSINQSINQSILPSPPSRPPQVQPRPNIAPLQPPPPAPARPNRPQPPAPLIVSPSSKASNPFDADFDETINQSINQSVHQPSSRGEGAPLPFHSIRSPPSSSSHATFTPPMPSSKRSSYNHFDDDAFGSHPFPSATPAQTFAPGGPQIPSQPAPPSRPPPPVLSPSSQAALISPRSSGQFGFPAPPPPPPGSRTVPTPRGPIQLAPGTVKTPFDDDF